MDEKPHASEQASSSQHPPKGSPKPRKSIWIRLIHYQKRLGYKRKAKREKENAEESPSDRAARKTASATKWIAGFTIVLAIVAFLNLIEVWEGGKDTSRMAIAAQNFADTAPLINGNINSAVGRLKDQADNMKYVAQATLDESRAWIAPMNMRLDSPVENGLPLHYVIHFINSGREPALGVVWRITAYGARYVSPTSGANSSHFGPNNACKGLIPELKRGAAVYPAPANYFYPAEIENTTDNQNLIRNILSQAQTLVMDGCFAYLSQGAPHKSAFRFFLRDIHGSPSFITDKSGEFIPKWNFQAALDGDQAN